MKSRGTKQHSKATNGPKGSVEHGILPSQEISRLITDGVLRLAEPLLDNQLQPASIDLRLGHVAYRVRASFLPGSGATVQSKLEHLQLHTISLS